MFNKKSKKMKRILNLIFIVSALLIFGCQTEDISPVNTGEKVLVTLTGISPIDFDQVSFARVSTSIQVTIMVMDEDTIFDVSADSKSVQFLLDEGEHELFIINNYPFYNRTVPTFIHSISSIPFETMHWFYAKVKINVSKQTNTFAVTMKRLTSGLDITPLQKQASRADVTLSGKFLKLEIASLKWVIDTDVNYTLTNVVTSDDIVLSVWPVDESVLTITLKNEDGSIVASNSSKISFESGKKIVIHSVSNNSEISALDISMDSTWVDTSTIDL